MDVWCNEDRIKNEYVRGTVKVAEASRKVQEARPRWYGHVVRPEKDYVGRQVKRMEIPGRRKRKTKEAMDGHN